MAVVVGLLAAACSSSSPSAAPTTTRAPSTAAHATSTTAVPSPVVGEPWPTFGLNAARTAQVDDGPAPTVAVAWRVRLDGQVYAQPLVADGLVYVATENDTVYALNPSTGAIRWSDHLGTPMPASSLPCPGNIDPSGITGTPLVDQSDGTLWVTGFVMPGNHVLFGIDLHTGQTTSSRTITFTGVDPLAEQQRSALAISGDNVDVAFGGLYGDCGNYKGMVVAFPTNPTGTQLTYVVPVTREGGIWAPGGPVTEPDGTVLVATGNGGAGSVAGGGSAVIALSPSLQRLDWFSPSNWRALNSGDLDLGSTAPALVAAQVFIAGKSGTGYLLSPSHLGGVGGQLASAEVCPGQAVGGDSVDGAILIVGCTHGLTALGVGDGTMNVSWQATMSSSPGPPVIDGSVVWTVDRVGHLQARSVSRREGALRPRHRRRDDLLPVPRHLGHVHVRDGGDGRRRAGTGGTVA